MYTHTLIHTCMCTHCTHIHSLIHRCTYTHTHTHSYTHVHTHICTHTHTHMYTHTCTYSHTHMYTHSTHTHTHTIGPWCFPWLFDWTISTITASESCVCTEMYIPSGESTLSTCQSLELVTNLYLYFCMGLQCILMYILCYFHIIICAWFPHSSCVKHENA